jgi:hypothetical protein
MNLSQGLRGKYHHVYFDSYFTSTPLALDLLRSGIYMCGTIRQNRKYFPEDLKNLPVRINYRTPNNLTMGKSKLIII